MIFEAHDFDKDRSYHDFLVSIHTKDLSKEFETLGQMLAQEDDEDGR